MPNRTIYARVYAPAPQHEELGKYVRVMIYEEGKGRDDRPLVADFTEHGTPEAFAFFSQLDDHYMRLDFSRPQGRGGHQ